MRIFRLLSLLLLLCFFVLPVMATSVTVNLISGTTNTTAALTGFATDGSMMTGMNVTAHFVGGGSQTVAWGTTGAGAGAAIGTGWSLAESGDTFGGTWTLSNLSGVAMTGLYIDAGPGDTVFDTTFGGLTGTPGSALGWTFELVSGGTGFDIVANYVDYVALDGDPPVGDLFRNLNIDFTNPGGFGTDHRLGFIADTDNLKFAGDIRPVPEPATLLLLGTGLILPWMRRIRK